MNEPAVADNGAAGRFELNVDGHPSELVYHLNGNRLVLIHTEVPQELEGRGLGGQLVRAALNKARAEHLTVVPRCPFAAKWLHRHPDEAAGVQIEWPGAR